MCVGMWDVVLDAAVDPARGVRIMYAIRKG